MSPTERGGASARIIDYLKTQARVLHKNAMDSDPVALELLRKNSPAVALGTEIQRKHALAAVAREIGFPNWKAVLECFGTAENPDFAAFLNPRRCHVYWNIWFADYEEACSIHAEHGGYLLCYRQQYVVVDDDYVRSLGIAPTDPRWEKIGRDWAKPADFELRDALAFEIVKEHIRSSQFQSLEN